MGPRRSGVFGPLDGVLFEAGSLEVRFAQGGRDIRAAQRLRRRVFFDESGARPFAAWPGRREICPFDAFADHLIVVDRSVRRFGAAPEVVGVYRLLRHEVAARAFGFASSGEFQVEALVARRPDLRFAELSRACVAAPARNGRTLELLWRGIRRYLDHYGIDVLFGCASFPGIDVAAHAATFAALTAEAPAGDEWDVPAAQPTGGTADFATSPAHRRAMLRELPPLVKAYLRLGARFGATPVVDPRFGTTDLLVVLPVAAIGEKYWRRFTAREAAPRIAA